MRQKAANESNRGTKSLQKGVRRMRRAKQERNPLREKPLCGPSLGAQICGWKSPATFKKHLPKLRPPIGKIHLRNGVFYSLEDIVRAAHRDATDQEIRAMVAEYQKKNGRKSHKKGKQWLIGPSEASLLFGWKDARTFKAHFKDMPRIKSVKKPNGVFYNLCDCLAAAYPELDVDQLKELVVAYKQRRSQQARKRGKK